MASTQLRNKFEAWKPEIDAYIFDEAESLGEQSMYRQFMNVQSVNRHQMSIVTASQGDYMEEVGEVGNAVLDELQNGYRTNFVQKKLRKKMIFSESLLTTDQQGEVRQRAEDFGGLIEASRNADIFGLIRNADSTTKYGGDKELLAIDHPLYDGNGTQPNTYADGVQRPLTRDNLKSLEDVLQAYTSGSGHILHAGTGDKKRILWVTEPLKDAAFELIESDYRPDTADNNVNYFMKGANYDLMVIPWLKYEVAKKKGEVGSISKTSSGNYWDTMWGIIDPNLTGRYWKMYIQEGKENGKFKSEINLENESLEAFAYDSYARGVASPIGFVMSKGNNSVVV